MNDQMIMENYLLNLKSTVEVFVHGTLESSNEEVRCLLKNGLNTILACQADTYDKMCENGWYKVNNVNKKSIKSTLTKIENKS